MIFFRKTFYFILTFCLFFSGESIASRLPEDWIDLDGLYGEERRQIQSLISKRKYFNRLMDNEEFSEALKYSQRILQNNYHTKADEKVLKNLCRGLESISAMREHFHTKLNEKEYRYARDYLTKKILTHPYHDKNDQILIDLVDARVQQSINAMISHLQNLINEKKYTSALEYSKSISSHSCFTDTERKKIKQMKAQCYKKLNQGKAYSSTTNHQNKNRASESVKNSSVREKPNQGWTYSYMDEGFDLEVWKHEKGLPSTFNPKSFRRNKI